MSYLAILKHNNLVRLLSRFLKSGAINIRPEDMKFYAPMNIQWDTPWLHTKLDTRMNCFLWKDIIFHGIVEQSLPRDKWFVPASCQDCWKVVVKMKTVKQLFLMEALQKRLDLPSKCGMELRDSVFGNYGAYFYNRGLEEGLERYKMVRAEIDNEPGLGSEISVILKRACTEYEHGIGPSDKWTIDQRNIDFEKELTRLFVDNARDLEQPEMVKVEVRQRWIEYAYKIGDETVLQFNGGKPLYPGYVTYHHLAKEKDKQNVA